MRIPGLLAITLSLSGLWIVPRSGAQSGDWNYQYIYTFQGNCSGGSLVIGAKGEIYGATGCYTPPQFGSIYRLAPPKTHGGVWEETILYTFQGGSDGSGDAGGVVIGSDGSLYGTTNDGGISTACGPRGCGTVFRLKPPSASGPVWTKEILYSFEGGMDAEQPNTGVVIGPDGSLFGTTKIGGPVGVLGTVYQVSPPTVKDGPWTEAVIYNFNNSQTDGCNPFAPVAVVPSGVLYGTSAACSSGTIFSLTPQASGDWTADIIRRFGSYGPVTIANGALYGTRSSGAGSVFELVAPSTSGGDWTQEDLHTFVREPSDGADPRTGVVVDNKGVVYGTTTKGGTLHSGVVYQLVPPAAPGGAWTENIIHNFTAEDNAPALPANGLVISPAGALYGATCCGADGNSGSIYELTPTGAGQP